MKNIIIAILSILLTISTCFAIHYYRVSKDQAHDIEIKNTDLQESVNREYNCQMARDEVYELFLSCVYPDGVPEYKPSYEE